MVVYVYLLCAHHVDSKRCAQESLGESTAAAVISSMVIQGVACLFIIYVYRVKYKEEHNPYALRLVFFLVECSWLHKLLLIGSPAFRRPLLTGARKFGALGGEGTGISPMEFVIAKKRLQHTRSNHKRASLGSQNHHPDCTEAPHKHKRKHKHKHSHVHDTAQSRP
eukprot:COSAG02_NODE_3311_length_6956_cov_3.255359_7_plen_166_part_00